MNDNNHVTPNSGLPQQKRPVAIRILKLVLLLFVFILLMGTGFVSVEWFSQSMGSFFFEGKQPDATLFQGNLQTSASTLINDTNANLPLQEELQNKTLSYLQDNVIHAKSALSLEMTLNGTTKTLYSKEENSRLPMASLTKLMTALVVLQAYDMDEKITISEEAMKQEGDQGNVKLGEFFSVKDLLYIALIESSNRAAYALSELISNEYFVAEMNFAAADLGMEDTHFADSTGLSSKSYSTAHDLAILSQHLFLYYPLFNEITGLQEYNLYVDGSLHHKLITTNKLLGKVPGVIGGKTGWTQDARGCFMIIQENPAGDRYMIHIILGSEDREGDMLKLIELSE